MAGRIAAGVAPRVDAVARRRKGEARRGRHVAPVDVVAGDVVDGVVLLAGLEDHEAAVAGDVREARAGGPRGIARGRRGSRHEVAHDGVVARRPVSSGTRLSVPAGASKTTARPSAEIAERSVVLVRQHPGGALGGQHGGTGGDVAHHDVGGEVVVDAREEVGRGRRSRTRPGCRRTRRQGHRRPPRLAFWPAEFREIRSTAPVTRSFRKTSLFVSVSSGCQVGRHSTRTPRSGRCPRSRTGRSRRPRCQRRLSAAAPAAFAEARIVVPATRSRTKS